MNDRIKQLEEEVARLQAIIDTHDLCHDLHGKVGACEFAEGCAREQRKIYGWAPHADNLAKQTFFLWMILGVTAVGFLIFFLCI